MESVDSNLEKISHTRILVVGDVMLDQYWMGDVSRISPEAPVPVIAVNQTENRLGGAGNVARNITSLGAKCTLLSIIGDDEAGNNLSNIATQAGISLALETEPGLPTTIKLRVLSRNQQLIRADFENCPSDDTTAKLVEQFEALLPDHDLVVFSDYGKGGLKYIETLIDKARTQNKPGLVDPKGASFKRYRGASMITPNLAEFEAVAGVVSDQEELHQKANEMISELELDHLLVTLSDKGMVLFDKQNSPLQVQAKSKEVYDVSGAGDTVIALMAMSMAARLPNQLALELANSAAGLVISKLGTSTVSTEELNQSMSKGIKQ